MSSRRSSAATVGLICPSRRARPARSASRSLAASRAPRPARLVDWSRFWVSSAARDMFAAMRDNCALIALWPWENVLNVDTRCDIWVFNCPSCAFDWVMPVSSRPIPWPTDDMAFSKATARETSAVICELVDSVARSMRDSDATVAAAALLMFEPRRTVTSLRREVLPAASSPLRSTRSSASLRLVAFFSAPRESMIIERRLSSAMAVSGFLFSRF